MFQSSTCILYGDKTKRILYECQVKCKTNFFSVPQIPPSHARTKSKQRGTARAFVLGSMEALIVVLFLVVMVVYALAYNNAASTRWDPIVFWQHYGGIIGSCVLYVCYMCAIFLLSYRIAHIQHTYSTYLADMTPIGLRLTKTAAGSECRPKTDQQICEPQRYPEIRKNRFERARKKRRQITETQYSRPLKSI